jgi:hypothetical protein
VILIKLIYVRRRGKIFTPLFYWSEYQLWSYCKTPAVSFACDRCLSLWFIWRCYQQLKLYLQIIGWLMKNELKRIRRTAVLVWFKIHFRSERTEENHEKLQPWLSVSGPIFETMISWIRSSSANLPSATFAVLPLTWLQTYIFDIV